MAKISYVTDERRDAVLEQLMNDTGIRTKQELIDTAVVALRWNVEEKKEGHDIVSVDSKSRPVKELIIPALEHVEVGALIDSKGTGQVVGGVVPAKEGLDSSWVEEMKATSDMADFTAVVEVMEKRTSALPPDPEEEHEALKEEHKRIEERLADLENDISTAREDYRKLFIQLGGEAGPVDDLESKAVAEGLGLSAATAAQVAKSIKVVGPIAVEGFAEAVLDDAVIDNIEDIELIQGLESEEESKENDDWTEE